MILRGEYDMPGVGLIHRIWISEDVWSWPKWQVICPHLEEKSYTNVPRVVVNSEKFSELGKYIFRVFYNPTFCYGKLLSAAAGNGIGSIQDRSRPTCPMRPTSQPPTTTFGSFQDAFPFSEISDCVYLEQRTETHN